MTTIGRAARRAARTPDVEVLFGKGQAHAALDLLELTALAWHDCYQEISPPKSVVDDILVCSRGELADLIQAARLAVEDYRDLRLAADAIRVSEDQRDAPNMGAFTRRTAASPWDGVASRRAGARGRQVARTAGVGRGRRPGCGATRVRFGRVGP